MLSQRFLRMAGFDVSISSTEWQEPLGDCRVLLLYTVKVETCRTSLFAHVLCTWLIPAVCYSTSIYRRQKLVWWHLGPTYRSGKSSSSKLVLTGSMIATER